MILSRWLSQSRPQSAARHLPRVRLSVQTLEGRDVPSHGVPTHSGDTVPVLTLAPGATQVTAEDDNGLVDAQRGYPLPPTKSPKTTDDGLVTLPPTVVLPPSNTGTTTTVVATSTTPIL